MSTIVITLFVYWVIGFIIACIDEDKAVFWAVGLVYPIAYVLTYPYRTIVNYRNSQRYFQKNNISMLQYFFGKRVQRKGE